jgi:hypothetical protein
MQLHGIHALLKYWPLGTIIFGIYLVTALPIQVLRNVREAMPYQVAYSALLGEVAFFCLVVLAGAPVQQGAVLPSWLIRGNYHLLAALMGLIVGAVWLGLDWNTEWGDRWHHIVTVPVFFYLAMALFPVIVWCGTYRDKWSAAFMASVYVGTIVYDIITHRMNQRGWIFAHIQAFLDSFK